MPVFLNTQLNVVDNSLTIQGTIFAALVPLCQLQIATANAVAQMHLIQKNRFVVVVMMCHREVKMVSVVVIKCTIQVQTCVAMDRYFIPVLLHSVAVEILTMTCMNKPAVMQVLPFSRTVLKSIWEMFFGQ
jgi:hypothetical protein